MSRVDNSNVNKKVFNNEIMNISGNAIAYADTFIQISSITIVEKGSLPKSSLPLV